MPNIALQAVDFLDADGKPIPGLVQVAKGDKAKKKISVGEHAVVLDAELI